MGKAAGRGNECVRERREKNAKKKKKTKERWVLLEWGMRMSFSDHLR